MSEIDAKVNMSLDEIIKMEKKKKSNGKAAIGARQNRNKTRGRPGLKGRGGRIQQNNVVGLKTIKKDIWKNNRGKQGFLKKQFNKNKRIGLLKSRSNLALNRINKNNNNINNNAGARGFNILRNNRANKFGFTRSRSRVNLNFMQGAFFTNKSSLKRTNSMPNLRDPNSVHNRLGYQSPAQIAYRNRVKRAKQLLLQRQQRINVQNQFKMPQAGKIMSLQRQQILTSQRQFTTGGLRSDQIARAQRRAQYEQKLIRMNSARINPPSNVNFMCTLGNDYTPNLRQRTMNPLQSRNSGNISTLRPLQRGRSPFRQNMQNLNMMGRPPVLNQRSRSRSRSRSRPRAIPPSETSEVDDREFSEVMYSLSGNLGVTGRTLNDRFSF